MPITKADAAKALTNSLHAGNITEAEFVSLLVDLVKLNESTLEFIEPSPDPSFIVHFLRRGQQKGGQKCMQLPVQPSRYAACQLADLISCSLQLYL